MSLASIQGVNLLAPLLTLPYLARVLGFEGLGLLATAAATCAWFGILIDWGFNLTATRAVSTSREVPGEVARIYTGVMCAKSALILISLLVLLIMALVLPSVRQYCAVYIYSFALVATQALFPTWIFQAMERMASVAVVNAVGKVIAAAVILLAVHRPTDVALVPLINTVVALLAAAATTYNLHARLGVRLLRPKLEYMKKVVKDGGAIFIATAAGNIYSQGPVLILNVFSDIASVGKYSIAQKIATASVSLFQSLAQAYFPRLSRLWLSSPKEFLQLVKRSVLSTQLASAALLGTLFAGAPLVYLLLTGAHDDVGITAIRYWLVIGQLTVLCVMLNPVLISIGRDRDMARMYVACSVLFLVYSCALTKMFALQGMLRSMVLVELSIAIVSVITLRRGIRKVSGLVK